MGKSKKCLQATGRIHIDSLVSHKCPTNRGVRQRDAVSPKLLTGVMEEILKKVDISEGISGDGEHLTNRRFPDDIGLSNMKTKQMETQNKLKGKSNQRKDEIYDKLHSQ